MDSRVRIYHNPKCTKCRITMQLLDDNGLQPDVITYLDTPPSASELEDILKLLAMEPRDLMRKHEEPYKALKLDDPQLTREQLIRAMIENPILIERPIVIKDNKAIIGRPPEKVLDIL